MSAKHLIHHQAADRQKQYHHREHWQSASKL
nr:MAG TPA: hypothetical protein [Caudoviricetes sp.]